MTASDRTAFGIDQRRRKSYDTNMSQVEEIPGTYTDAIRILVRWHAEGGPADLQIYSFPDPAKQMVRLVEVSDDFLGTGEINPLILGPSELFAFRSAVALATPDEWRAIESRQLRLPAGWDRAASIKVWP